MGKHNGSWKREVPRLAIYERDGYRCVYCDKNFGREELTLDHCAQHGGNGSVNLITACRKCNSRRGQKSLREFLIVLQREGMDTKEIKRRIKNATRRKIEPALLEDCPYAPTPEELNTVFKLAGRSEGAKKLLRALSEHVTPEVPIWRIEQKELIEFLAVSEATLRRVLVRLEKDRILGIDRRTRPHGHYFQPVVGDRHIGGADLERLTSGGGVKLVDNSDLQHHSVGNVGDLSPVSRQFTGHIMPREPMEIPEFKEDFFNLTWPEVFKLVSRKAKEEVIKKYFKTWSKEFCKKHPEVLAKNVLTREDLVEFRNDPRFRRYTYLAAGWTPGHISSNKAVWALARIIRRYISSGGGVHAILELCGQEAEDMAEAVNNRLNNKGSHEALIHAEPAEFRGVDYRALLFRASTLNLITSKVPEKDPTHLKRREEPKSVVRVQELGKDPVTRPVVPVVQSFQPEDPELDSFSKLNGNVSPLV